MSVQTEGSERESVVLPPHGDLAFGALMDALAPEPETEGGSAAGAAGTGNEQAAVPPTPAGGNAAGGGAPPVAPGGQPAGTPVGSAQAGGTGDAATGQPGQPAADGDKGTPVGSAEQSPAVSERADIPADWTASAEALAPKFGELSTKVEENIAKVYQQQAYTTAREEYENYFLALEKHPRLLVGTQVPAIGKEGMETLRDSNDAKEWQEAVRALLIAEINEQAEVKKEEARDYLATVHASIDLFKNNKDLIPGTKTFDRELADAFATMMKPYEYRADGKLQGYTIPVQPIIDSLRGQLQAQRQAAPKSGATNPPPAAPNPPSARPQVEPPQAGIQSKAGSVTDKEDFSTLFGTIGLPNLQI